MKEELIMPNYEHCILNTITSILKYYNVETNHKSLESLDKILEKKYKNIIFLVLDGMGEHILEKLSPDGYFRKNEIECVTSVFPSTTTAALTTYYSGKPPYESGWIAWSQYFKEYGRAIDMLPHTESYKNENLNNARMNVFKNIVNYETIFSRIEKASPNVKAYEIVPSYSDKRSKRSLRADTIEEVIEGIKILSENPEEKFMLAYCENPDNILHKFGAFSEEGKEYICGVEKKVEELKKSLNDNTILIISADHGHKDIEKEHTILDYPEIQDCLIMPISLEQRAPTFWVKEDRKKEFEELFNKEFSEEFMLLTKEEFLNKHFLGYGNKHPKIDDFIGNYIALSIAGSVLKVETYYSDEKKRKKSTHCGLTKYEMEVPVIVIK